MSRRIKKILTIFTIVIVVSTVGLSILYLFTPILIGYQITSNGIIEYFKNVIDPSFIIKAYLNNKPVNAIISVYINQPNKVIFYKEFYGESLKIPFTSIENYVKPWKKYYVKPWKKYENENTSLLVIATYTKGNETFTSAEEIEYNPNWVLKNQPIQIVAKINIIPQLIKLNNTIIQQENNKIHKEVYEGTPGCSGCCYGRSGEKYAYIVNMSKEVYEEPPVLVGGKCEYVPVTCVIYFYNFSVPLNWITISNNVNKNDNYTFTCLCTALEGKVSWYAVSNSSNYGGPYIGVSYSANVNWETDVAYYKSQVSNLFDPTIYTYYNATIAVVIYQVYEYEPSHVKNYGTPYVPLNDYLTVFEILWASPRIGYAIESCNGLTRVIYTNSTGEYTYYLKTGNGSVTLFYNYFEEFIGNQKSGQCGYAQWRDGKITTTGNICIIEDGFWFSVNSFEEYVHNNRIASVALDAVDLVISILALEVGIESPIVDALIGFDANEYFFFSSSNQIENYFIFIHTSVRVFLPCNTSTYQVLGAGHVYVSYLNYSPLLGFVMNYSSYYYGG